MPLYDDLARIYEALQEHRKHHSFVRANTLPKADYYLLKQRVVVEFDESQHFTMPRYISLALYPSDLTVGFDRHRWMAIAARLDRHDNDPIDRDEQRAWYDTLRDFSSALLGHGPTARLFPNDAQWCLLNPNDPRDVNWFLEQLENVETA